MAEVVGTQESESTSRQFTRARAAESPGDGNSRAIVVARLSGAAPPDSRACRTQLPHEQVATGRTLAGRATRWSLKSPTKPYINSLARAAPPPQGGRTSTTGSGEPFDAVLTYIVTCAIDSAKATWRLRAPRPIGRRQAAPRSQRTSGQSDSRFRSRTGLMPAGPNWPMLKASLRDVILQRQRCTRCR